MKGENGMELLEMFGLDKEECMKSLRLKVVNYDKNKGYLKGKPHKKFLDLACVAMIKIPNTDGVIIVNNGLLEFIGIDENTLFAKAMENTMADEKFSIAPLGNVLYEMSGDEEFEDDMDNGPYVARGKHGSQYNEADGCHCAYKRLHNLDSFHIFDVLNFLKRPHHWSEAVVLINKPKR